MISPGALIFRNSAMSGALLLLAATIALAFTSAHADPNTPTAHPVTVTPPLQVVPATRLSTNVQQRMRECNSSADSRKLPGAARETFMKSCMAPRRGHAPSRTGSQPKPNP